MKKVNKDLISLKNDGKKRAIECIEVPKKPRFSEAEDKQRWKEKMERSSKYFASMDSEPVEFPDGNYPAGGKSDIEGIFPPPYYEWFQFEKDFTVYFNLEECITYLCEYITANGPFDGFLGFSQGKVLKEHPLIKFFISISGSKFRDPSICDVAYKDPIKAKSIHFIGDKDWLKLPGEDLASAFDKPLILRHPQGHTVPRLDEVTTNQLRNWINEEVLCQPKVGVSVIEHGKDHEKEVRSTNPNKVENGV
ncbi:hypothetical protein V8G54_019005 [Vigna mungo]|uniref:Serine hydrolase domain-containing protein n=1 Tax=Vigna mungo TaxID=3915 RepID=A0AAQ3RV72_VIGMU